MRMRSAILSPSANIRMRTCRRGPDGAQRTHDVTTLRSSNGVAERRQDAQVWYGSTESSHGSGRSLRASIWFGIAVSGVERCAFNGLSLACRGAGGRTVGRVCDVAMKGRSLMGQRGPNRAECNGCCLLWSACDRIGSAALGSCGAHLMHSNVVSLHE